MYREVIKDYFTWYPDFVMTQMNEILHCEEVYVEFISASITKQSYKT